MKSIFTVIIFLISINLLYAQSNGGIYKVSQSKSIKNDTLIVMKLFEVGDSLFNINLDSAANYYKKAYAIALKNNYVNGLYRYYSSYGSLLTYKSKYLEDIELMKESLVFARKMKNNEKIAKGLANLGNVYVYVSEFQLAINYYQESLELFKKINSLEFVPKINIRISNAYYNANMPDKSLEYANLALMQSLNLKDTSVIIQAYKNIGSAYFEKSIYAKAKENFTKGLSFSKVYEEELKQAEIISNIARIESREKNFEKAIKMGESSLKFFRNAGNNFYMVSELTFLSEYYLGIKNYSKSLLYIKEALKIAEKEKMTSHLTIIYEALFNTQKASKNYKEALLYHELFTNMYDSLSNKDLKQNLQDLDVKYKTANKEKEILKLTSDKNKQNLYLTGAGLGIVLLGLFSFFYYRNNKRKQQIQLLSNKLDSQNAERQRISREMHDDLGGNLTSLIYLSHSLKTQYPDNTQIKKLGNTSLEISETLNEIVWSLNQNQNKLADWVQYTKGRMSEFLESADLNYKFNFSNDIPERTLNDDEKRNLYLVCKEAINNIIKHAQAKNVLINMDFSNGIKISIKDNGSGFNETTKTKTGSGNGLSNMTARMVQIGGRIKWIENNGTEVKISLS